MSRFMFILKGNISVHTMQRNCGIFIAEHNHAMGWNAHDKMNVIYSIGGDANILSRNMAILNDQDLIDTPIDDRDIHLLNERIESESHTHIQLDEIQVNTMTQNSAIFMGKGTVTGMDANEKINHGAGSIYGNINKEIQNLNINDDRDIIDGIMNDQDIKIAITHRG